MSSKKLWLWSIVALICVVLSAATIHYVIGVWAWSAVLLFGVAGLLGLYFGVTACGLWTETPLLEMLRPRNRRYFGGGGAILRHVAFLVLWSTAIGVYTLVLVYLLRYGVDVVGSEWAERLPASLPKLDEPGGRLGLTIIIAFLLCRATVRTEQVEAARRGEELRLDDGSSSDEDSPQHKGLLKAPYVRLMIFFLTPIYKELRRKTGLMESAAHALLMREFSYAELTRAGYVLIERYDHRAVLELKEQLEQSSFPEEPKKELEIRAGLVASLMYELDGYYGARDKIRAYNAEPDAEAQRARRQAERRRAARTNRDVKRVRVSIPCSVHGARATRLVDYRTDALGFGMIADHCACLESAAQLAFELNDQTLTGEICHRAVHVETGTRQLYLGVELNPASASAALPALLASLRPPG
jgi:hypothetical protein